MNIIEAGARALQRHILTSAGADLVAEGKTTAAVMGFAMATVDEGDDWRDRVPEVIAVLGAVIGRERLVEAVAEYERERQASDDT